MIRNSFHLLLLAIASLFLEQAASAAGTVYNVPPNSLAPLFDGIGYQIPAGVRVNVSAAAPVDSANFYVVGGELFYNTPGVAFPGPFGIGVSGGGYVEFADGFSANLQVTAGGVGKVLDGIIVNALVNEGLLDILSVRQMWLDHLQGTVNVSGGRVGTLNLGDFGFGVPITQPAVLNQTGGVVGESFFNVHSGGVANISGGAFGPAITPDSIGYVGSGGIVNLIVTSMEVDGVPLSELSPDVAVEVTDRDVLVTGVLARGDGFAFRVVTDFDFGTLTIDAGGKLMVTLAIPEPSSLPLVAAGAAVSWFAGRQPA